jgi:hypothetical protein
MSPSIGAFISQEQHYVTSLLSGSAWVEQWPNLTLQTVASPSSFAQLAHPKAGGTEAARACSEEEKLGMDTSTKLCPEDYNKLL